MKVLFLDSNHPILLQGLKELANSTVMKIMIQANLKLKKRSITMKG